MVGLHPHAQRLLLALCIEMTHQCLEPVFSGPPVSAPPRPVSLRTVCTHTSCAAPGEVSLELQDLEVGSGLQATIPFGAGLFPLHRQPRTLWALWWWHLEGEGDTCQSVLFLTRCLSCLPGWPPLQAWCPAYLNMF